MHKKKKKNSLAKMLSTMHRIYERHMAKELLPFGFNLTEKSIILHLDSNAGESLNAFAHRKKINKALLSKTIKKLQAANLVKLEVDEHHKQRFKLYLTEKAEEIVPPLRQVMTDYEKKALAALSASERQQFLGFFNRVYQQEIDDE